MSYCSLDMRAIKILHKTRTLEDACSLVWLEMAPESDVYISDLTTGEGFRNLADQQVVALYKSVTGRPWSQLTRRQAIQLITDAIESAAFTEVKTVELDAQCSYASQFDPRPQFRYVYGSYRPQPVNGNELPFVQGSVTDEQIQSAQAGRLPAFAAPAPVPRTIAQAAPAPAVLPPQREPQAQVQSANAPAGKTAQLIWSVMDRIWETAGSPRDVSLVLSLRKTAMAELEGIGIKRNTASNELGQWQKNRLAP